MPRRARLILPNVPLHLIQRGNNRQVCFVAEEDYRFYLDWLKEYADKTGCRIHAYVLMTNHVHLLVSSGVANGVAVLMKALGQRYVQYVNRTYRRSGTLWEGRFRSGLLQEGAYFLTCQRYIELNPVRARMVARPVDYRWSSARANYLGEASDLLTPHPLYLALGKDQESRLAAYQALFLDELKQDALGAIRDASNGNFVLGDDRFTQEIEAALGRRVSPGLSGRPRKKALSERVENRGLSPV